MSRFEALLTSAWFCAQGADSYSNFLGHILFVNLTYTILLKRGIYHAALPEVVVYATAVGIALTAAMAIGRYIDLPLANVLKELR